MIHEMKLFQEPFEKIKNNEKNIEVRLFDNKRKNIKLGDIIIFKKLPNMEEEISVKVIGMTIFSSFEELFSNFDSKRFGHDHLTIQEQIKKIRKIYNEGEEKQHGVVGIHIQLVK